MNGGVYRTLITGHLEQQSGLSVGGRDFPAIADSIFAVNGRGEPRLRGTALAGALIASLRTLYGSEPNTKLPQSITYGAKQDYDFLKDSAWRVYNARLESPEAVTSHYRSGVGILHKTGAAAEGALYEVEFLPRGTRWNFLLEIDETLYKNSTEPLAYAAHLLRYWRDAGGLIGRDVARGLGWIKFIPDRVYRLTTNDITKWPDATRDVGEILEDLRPGSLPFDELLGIDVVEAHRPKNPRPVRKGTIRIEIGKSENEDYGLDTLSLGNSALSRNLQQWDGQPVIQSFGMKPECYLDQNLAEADMTFSWMHSVEPGESRKVSVRPYIPGSSLRGPLRHAWSWWLRRQGEAVWDPASGLEDPDDDTDRVVALFGSKAQSARFLISDARLEGEDYAFLLLEQHAEDEFTGGVFGSGKFNRLCLVRGIFESDFLFEHDPDSAKAFEDFKAFIEILGNLGKNRMLPLGGGKFRGHGWVKWSIQLNAGLQEKADE